MSELLQWSEDGPQYKAEARSYSNAATYGPGTSYAVTKNFDDGWTRLRISGDFSPAKLNALILSLQKLSDMKR